MPYAKGQRLPAETASRLGHLEVLRSPLVSDLCRRFAGSPPQAPTPSTTWIPLPQAGERLPIVFGVDGSLQTIRDSQPPGREISFVKTALLRLDLAAMAKLDPRAPHPLALRDLMQDAALYHATVLPLKNISMGGLSLYDAVREIIFESLQDASLSGEPLATLRWLAYEEWSGNRRPLPLFSCPHCLQSVATLPYGALSGACPGCGGRILLSDMLGFHQDMGEESAPEGVATAYMLIHETLLLFMAIRYFWEHRRGQISDCLWVKDGPLAIRAQYSKLVNPIRRFLAHARDQGYPIHLIGQEKSGAFFDHLALIGPQAPASGLFLPGSVYINAEVQRGPQRAATYGRDTNYGAKLFLKLRDDHTMVVSIPTGAYVAEPQLADLVGLDRILATLPGLLGHLHEGSLLPIERAHAVASLSTYPSAAILKLFANQAGQIP